MDGVDQVDGVDLVDGVDGMERREDAPKMDGMDWIGNPEPDPLRSTGTRDPRPE